MSWCWALVCCYPAIPQRPVLIIASRPDRVCVVWVSSFGNLQNEWICTETLSLASVLSVKGNKVLHIDRNDHYGGYVTLELPTIASGLGGADNVSERQHLSTLKPCASRILDTVLVLTFPAAVQEVPQRWSRRGALEEVREGQRLEHRLGSQAVDGQRGVDKHLGVH